MFCILGKVLKYLIGAGGTGGHLYPAMAVADQIKKIDENAEFIFSGRADKIEGRVIPQTDYRFIPLNISASKSIKGLINLYLSAIKLKNIIINEKVDAVICTGCYISIPPGMAAIKTKTPLFLLESNVNPGKAVRMLASKSTNIFTTFSNTKEYFNPEIAEKVLHKGNPIREEIINLPEKSEALNKFNFENEKHILLVFGGSLGAEAINTEMEKNIAAIAEKINVVWQTGKAHKVTIDTPPNVKVLDYIDDMATAYSAADLVLCRSGATTITELCVTGKPAIMIPYKHAATNEQYHNAKFLEDNAGAVLIDNDDIKEKLFDSIIRLIENSDERNEIARKTKDLGKPEAAKDIADIIFRKINE